MAQGTRRGRVKGRPTLTVRDEIKAIRGPDGALAFRGASVFARKVDGRPVARVTLPDGRYRYVYGKDAGEIVQRVRQFALSGDLEQPQAVTDLTLGAWIDRWILGLEGSKKRSTIATYQRYLAKHVPAELRRKALAKVTKDDLQALYRAKRAAGLGDRTVLHLHAVIHACLGAAEKDLGVRNPAATVEKPKAARPEMNILEGGEIARLIAAARGDRLEALIVLAVTTGMREGELLGLRWRDVDLEDRELHVVGSLQGTTRANLTISDPKTTSSRRVIPLGSLALDALVAHLDRQEVERERAGSKWETPDVERLQDTELVFPNELGGFLSTTTLARTYHRILTEAHVNGRRLRFHDLRHTAITAWLQDGTDPVTASRMAGHASVSITLDLYGHATTTSQRAAADLRDRRLREMLEG
jgi:integrase